MSLSPIDEIPEDLSISAQAITARLAQNAPQTTDSTQNAAETTATDFRTTIEAESSSAIAAEQVEDANRETTASTAASVSATTAVDAAEQNSAVGTGRTAMDAVRDQADVSATARALARDWLYQEWLANIRGEDAPLQRATAQTPAATNSSAVRELLQSLADYNNDKAVAKYLSYLRMFSVYGNVRTPYRNELRAANLYAPNDPFVDLGMGPPINVDRRTLMREVDAWLRGEGVFRPEMLASPSSDGFRFIPADEQSRLAANAAEVRATYDQERIAYFLAELAKLTPLAFLFYDPTGLGPLSLIDRQAFFLLVGQAIEEVEPEVRPVDLEYAFNPDGALNFELVWEEGLSDVQKRIQDAINKGGEPPNAERAEKLRALGRRVAVYA